MTQNDPSLRHDPHLRSSTRRHFFSQCSMGIGSIALATLLADRELGAQSVATQTTNPLQPRVAHFPAKAKNVIFLFMAGGPSQFETFDYKPKLNELNGQP